MSTSHDATIITDFLTWKLSNVARCLEWISFTSLRSNGKFQNKFQPLMKITLITSQKWVFAIVNISYVIRNIDNGQHPS